MNFKTLRKLCMVICAVFVSSALVAESTTDTQLVSQQQTRSRNSNNSRNNNNNGNNNSCWLPYFMKLRDAEPNLGSFYNQSVGIGFLYFSGIQGTISISNDLNVVKTNKKLTGHLMYNRTPIVEFVVGTDVFRWWKVGLSYQHQGGVVVQTQPQILMSDPANAFPQSFDFKAHVRLDAVMFKTYFMFPFVINWLGAYHEPYLGLAVGPGWQTWTGFNDYPFNGTRLRPKISANCVYTVDLGMKIRKALPTYFLSFTAGCKYTQWGAARSIGKESDQFQSTANRFATNDVQANRLFFFNPIRIRTVYQFAPYIGVELGF